MHPRIRSRRGNALSTALMLTTLIGFSALAVDIGLIRVASTELQASLDSAAVSAASELDGTADGIGRARARAVAVAAQHQVMGSAVTVAAADVLVGNQSAAGVFTPYAGGGADTVNAVRIADTDATIASALGGVAFGLDTYDVDARAMAARTWTNQRATSSNCFLPFAIPDCHLAGTPPGQNPPPFKFTFSPTPTDAIAWGDPSGNPNANGVRNQLNGQCAYGPVAVGSPMYVDEGVKNTALSTIAAILNGSGAVPSTPWSVPQYGAVPLRNGTTANTPAQSSVSAGHWGNTLQGVVALVDGGPNCSAVSFTGAKTITGFAWAVIYDVKDTGSGGKNVWMQLDLVNPHNIWGNTGTAVGPNVFATDPPRMQEY